MSLFQITRLFFTALTGVFVFDTAPVESAVSESQSNALMVLNLSTDYAQLER